MSFLETRLPEDISYGFVGGPRFSTDITISNNGYEHRNINWSSSLAKYTISYSAMSAEQTAKLCAFFYVCRGKAYAFRFKDWSDYQVVQQIIGTGNGSQTKFQLQKTYQVATQQYIRIINKPVEDSIIIYFNSNIISSEYTVDYTLGMIEFKTPPTAGTVISSDFEFDVPARFDSDFLPSTIYNHQSYSCNDLSIVEVKV